MRIVALIEALDGHTEQARCFAKEISPRTATRSDSSLAEICRILIACDATQHARELVSQVAAGAPRLLHNATSGRAQVAEADHDYASAATLYQEAADRWRNFGHPFELAHALAGHSRCLARLGHAADAAIAAHEAASIFNKLGVRGPAFPALPCR